MNCVPTASPEAAAAKGLSPQAAAVSPGCNGGDAWMILDYMSAHPIPDETCLPYQAKNGVCSAMGVCRNCFPHAQGAPVAGGCWAIPSYVGYTIAEFGKVTGEMAMMQAREV